MASRYIRFDVNELAKAAAAAVDSKYCTRFEKLPEGLHSKAFLLTMDDGKEVVAKVPNPCAGEPHHTTASEVATMDIMRNFLRTPTPKVFAWCSHAEKTPVGAEYIIMEKAPGVPLETVWSKLKIADQFSIVKTLSGYQQAWSSALYEGYGSIYYASDLTEQHRLPLGSLTEYDRFALGPITGRDWNDERRQSVVLDRGPWKTLESYLGAVGRRELTCVKELPKLPPPVITLCGPGTYQSNIEKKVRALEWYLQLYEHLAPSDSSIRKPSAWHGDLHVGNIFVNPASPTEVTRITDWQSTEVAPLFLQARQPFILNHKGLQAMGLSRPRRPSNYDELSPKEQRAAEKILHDQSLCVMYKLWTRANAPEIWKCFEFKETPAFELLQLAATLLVDGEGLYMSLIVDLLRSNPKILEPSGFSIPDDVMVEVQADEKNAIRGVAAMSMIQEAMGELFPERGCVKSEQYDEAKDALRQCKEQIIEMYATTDAERTAWNKSWPFDD